MVSTRTLITATLKTLGENYRPLLIFHLFFTLLAAAVLVPASAWLLAALQPFTQAALTSTSGLVAFFGSPAGLFWILSTVTVASVLVVAQVAGMMLIPATTRERNRYRIAAGALWTLGLRLPRLAALTVLRVGAHLTASAPFLIAAALAWERLLLPYDPGWLLQTRPPVLWLFVVLVTLCCAGLLAVNAWLYLRWILAVPLIALENATPLQALKRSRLLTRGKRLAIARAASVTALLVVLLPSLFTLGFDALGGPLLDGLPDRMSVVGPVVTAYVVIYLVATMALAFIGFAFHGVLLYALYQHTGARAPVRMALPPARAGRLAWSAEALIVVLAIVQGTAALQSFDTRDDIAVTAHRGSSMKAPENTLSAIEQGIADGADYIEVDVRHSADGVVVVLHDADLRRVAGIDRFVWDMSYAQMREVDVGSWFSNDFAGERIPTLEQVIEAVRGRTDLYVDIKPSAASPDLTAGVVALLQAENMIDGTRIGSKSPSVLREVRELEPRLATTLFAQFAIGQLDRELFDALGLRVNRVTTAQIAIAHAHGHELHVWTVNDTSDMERMIDMGVDNIITDYPDRLAEILDTRAGLSDTERLVVKMRNWLRH